MTDDFIGTELATKAGSVYKINGVNLLKGSKRKYSFTCSVCSNDSELFPELWMRKGDIISGKLGCGCASNPSWSKRQYEVLCSRKAQACNVTFLSITDTLVTSKSKVSFTDAQGILQSNMTVAHFLNRYDPVNKDQATRKGVPKRCGEYYTDKFTTEFGFPTGTIIERVVGNLDRFSVFCPICATSDYCLEGVTSPWFTAHYSNLAKGSRPCMCSSHYAYNQKEYELRLHKDLLTFGKFEKFVGEFKGNSTYFKWTCNCGSLREQKIADFLAGKRCPNCAVYGFKDDMPANLYLVTWESNGTKVLKVGITNNTVSQRTQQQRLHSKFTPIEVVEVSFSKGSSARYLEKEILTSYQKDTSIRREDFVDGYTELLSYESYDHIKRHIEEYVTSNK